MSSLQESASSKPSSSSRTFAWFSWMYLKKFSLACLSISSGRSWSSIASQIPDLISLHLSKSSTSIDGKDASHSSCSVAQSYASFCKYVVFPMPGSPSIKRIRGFWQSGWGLKIAVMLVISSSISVPRVFSLFTIFSRVKISFRLKLRSSHHGNGTSRPSRLL